MNEDDPTEPDGLGKRGERAIGLRADNGDGKDDGTTDDVTGVDGVRPNFVSDDRSNPPVDIPAELAMSLPSCARRGSKEDERPDSGGKEAPAVPMAEPGGDDDGELAGLLFWF